jgi:ABC-type antimicrobial peptide transport system permease subunit
VLTESCLLASLGGLFGVALAVFISTMLKNVGGPGLPRMNGLSFGWSFAWISLVAATAAALFAGLLPALRAMQRQPADLVSSAARTSSVGRRERWLLSGTAVL